MTLDDGSLRWLHEERAPEQPFFLYVFNQHYPMSIRDQLLENIRKRFQSARLIWLLRSCDRGIYFSIPLVLV